MTAIEMWLMGGGSWRYLGNELMWTITWGDSVAKHMKTLSSSSGSDGGSDSGSGSGSSSSNLIPNRIQ